MSNYIENAVYAIIINNPLFQSIVLCDIDTSDIEILKTIDGKILTTVDNKIFAVKDT